MICSLDFTSVYGGLAVGAGFALATWAAWSARFQQVGLHADGRAMAAVSSPNSAATHPAQVYASLIRQARARVELGHDASEIFERAIGLVRARRFFVISITIVLWTAVMLTAAHFFEGNSVCLRRMVDGAPVKLEHFARHAPPASATRVKWDAMARSHFEILGTASFSVSGYRQRLPVLKPAASVNRVEVARGPA
jgi:hypothetical protein